MTKEGLKRIENIQSGEYVLAEDVESGTREYKKVIRTTVRKTNKIIHLVIAKEDIETTGNHPFWVPEQGWVPAEKLQLYDEVELSDGTHALIENLWHEKTGEEIPVYNMEVEDFHTYYIAKTGVLLHNDGGCGHSGGKVRISSKSGKYSNVTFATEDKLVSHFEKHGNEFRGIYNSADEYLQGARDVMNNGYKVEYSYKGETRVGYVQFMGNNSKGRAKFAFVGTNNEGYITTFHTESGRTFWKLLNGENIPVINPK